MKEAYVTEPEVIDLQQLRQLLPESSYSITAGKLELEESFKSGAQVLIIRSATNVTEEFVDHFPNLKAVVRIGTGLDNVDTDFCKTKGISVYNAPGANADAVAEYVTAIILYVRRKLHLLTKEDIQSWNRFKFTGQGLSGRTVGIIGYGNIGRLLHKKLQGLGCSSFLVYDPYLTEETAQKNNVDLVSLKKLLSESDIISLHLPLTNETKYLLNSKNLTAIKDGAILINASRGGVVEESAILSMIGKKDFTYAADTVEGEPHVNSELLHSDQIVVTPHIASLTTDSEEAMLRTAIENYIKGAND